MPSDQHLIIFVQAQADIGRHVDKLHTKEPEAGPGGYVWAQTLSKRRPEAQDPVPSPPGPTNPV